MDAIAKKPAVVLLSGGLDSATVAAIARNEGFERQCSLVSYGQRHSCELEAARRVARSLGVASIASPISICARSAARR